MEDHYEIIQDKQNGKLKGQELMKDQVLLKNNKIQSKNLRKLKF